MALLGWSKSNNFTRFTTFYRVFGLQVIDAQEQALFETLQKKSCLKTYRRFFGFGNSCFNHQRNDEHETQS
jgi:hypothetical protein